MVKRTELERAFDRYNRLYFRGKLPRIRVKWSSTLLQKHGAMGVCCGAQEIQITTKLKFSRRYWKSTLLHEMAHLKFHAKGMNRVRHGKRFKKEIKRLIRAGVFNRLIW